MKKFIPPASSKVCVNLVEGFNHRKSGTEPQVMPNKRNYIFIGLLRAVRILQYMISMQNQSACVFEV